MYFTYEAKYKAICEVHRFKMKLDCKFDPLR